jgi:hypothetical protein
MKRFLMMLLLLYALCLTAAAQSDDAQPHEAARLPANLVMNKHDRPLVEKVWRRSATFRRQCERIAQASELTVKLSFNPKLSAPGGCQCHALTTTDPAYKRILVRIFHLEHAAEMLGHEFEHVVEQLEGLKLRTLAATKGARVYENLNGSFETRRAILAGRQVKAEYHRAKRNGVLAKL